MSMEKNKSNIEPVMEKKEAIDHKTPIIDFIRHGKSIYKEHLDKDYEFDSSIDESKLNEQNLDLTSEGIKDIENSAMQLLNIIDTENEVVILAESPRDRTKSSLLVMKKILESKGVKVLNRDKNFTSDQLRSVALKNHEDNVEEFMKTTNEYTAEENNKNNPINKIKEDVAKRMGKEFKDLYTDDSFEKVDQRLKRFVRHAKNIHNWLSDATNKLIKGKRIRFVCLTHEELPSNFLTKNLGENLNMENGQILEFSPDRLDEDDKTKSTVTLYDRKDKDKNIVKENINI
jgi:hypothetical protein